MRRFLFLVSFLLFAPSLVFAQTPNDTWFGDQWYLHAISAPSAWDVETGSRSVIVAVLDTGIDLDHEDIAPNLWTNAKEIPNNNKDDDGNGYVDDVHGWDFIDNDNDPSPTVLSRGSYDAASHGTLIAGEIGAVGNNGLGMAGVAWSVSLMPVRMLGDDGSGSEGNAAKAIRYAVANGAKVINLSFAGNESHSTLTDAVSYAYAHGVVVVAAMGNDGRNADVTPVYPACLRTGAEDWVIGVTAITQANLGTNFTNYGSTCADIAAPGSDIYGLAYQDASQGYPDGYVGPWNGTSMASPLVSGAAALLFAKYPTLSAGDVRNILKLSVDPIRATGFPSGALGAGKLNVARALDIASAYAPAASSTPTPDVPSAQPSSAEPPPSEKTIDQDTSVLQYSYVAFGAPSGVLPEVDVYHASGKEYARFQAYSSNFRGGVRVATISNGTRGIPNIVTAAGESGGPHVRVFTPFGALIHEFFAYDKASSHGVNVTVGDMNGDGTEEIVTSVGSGVSQDIVTWSESGQELSRFTASLFPVSSPLSVTAVDYDDDISEELAVVGVIDGVARVALYDSDGTFLVSFTPYDAKSDVSVSRVDLDGDLYDDIAVAGLSGTNDVRVFTKIGAMRGATTLAAQERIGDRIVGTDLDLDGSQDLVISENRDAGLVTMMSSDLKTLLGTFHAPTFNSTLGAYLAAW